MQKYGGTSVADTVKIENVAKRIARAKNDGYEVVAVVSAMGNTTDELLKMAYMINKNPSNREMDVLLSTGEQISVSLLAMAVEALNLDVVSLTGQQCGIITNSSHKRARILRINTERILGELVQGKIIIAAGFQGVSGEENITTLGRGGSDTTAVALAAALKAEKCEIYTDVDGVYTTDPRIVKNARILRRISYDEMLEFAQLGARVLHPRSVELARKFKVPLIVRSSFNNFSGTEITEVDKVEKVLVRGVTLDDDIAKISVLEVPDKPGIAYSVFSTLAKNNINFDMIIQNVNRDSVNDITFTVKKEDLDDALRISEEIAKQIGAEKVEHDTSVTKLSVIGTGIAGSAEVASAFFGTLYEKEINIQMISTSEIKISCIIDQKQGIDALQSLHERFKLDGIEIISDDEEL